MAVLGKLTLMLKPEYVAKGYGLTEDEDFVYLHIPGKDKPAIFSAIGVTVEGIENHIAELEKA